MDVISTTIICFLVCSAIIPTTDSVPMQRVRRQDFGGDSVMMMMPGVHVQRTRVEERQSSSGSSGAPPPVIFGESLTFDSHVPISFGGDSGGSLPVQGDDKGELIPVKERVTEASPVSFEGGDIPNAVLFPGGGTEPNEVQTQTPLPASSSSGDEGSGDNVLFPGAIRVNVNSEGEIDGPPPTVGEEEECGPESGTTFVNGSCSEFLSRSSCPRDEWLVESVETNEIECAPRPCPLEELLLKDKCVSISDETVCPEGQMLYVDFTGVAHCDCRPNFIYDPWTGKCYAEGDQGYCNFGEQLYVEEETGLVKCRSNPCLMDGYIYHNETTTCYRKMYRGVCQTFLITHRSNMTAECSQIPPKSIFDIATMKSCASGSLRDYAGNCRQQFRVPSVTTFPTTYGGCPGTFIKDSRGICRRTHRLFG